MGQDGKTPYERFKGRNSNIFGFEFGGRVLFRRVLVSSKLAKLDSLLEHWSFRRVPLHDWGAHGGHSRGSMEESNSPQTARRRARASRRCGESRKYTPWTTDDGATTMKSSQEEEVHIDYDRDLGCDIPPMALEPA